MIKIQVEIAVTGYPSLVQIRMPLFHEKVTLNRKLTVSIIDLEIFVRKRDKYPQKKIFQESFGGCLIKWAFDCTVGM